MKNYSTLLVVGVVVLIVYLWMQINKPKATTGTAAKTTTTTDPLTAALLKLLSTPAQPAKTGSGTSAPPSGVSNGQATAGGANLQNKAPDSNNGNYTDPETGLTYNEDGLITGVNGQTGNIIGTDSKGNPLYLGNDGDYVHVDGTSVPATDVTWLNSSAGVTNGPVYDPQNTTGPSNAASDSDIAAALVGTASDSDIAAAIDDGGGDDGEDSFG